MRQEVVEERGEVLGLENIDQCPVGSSARRHSGPASSWNQECPPAIVSLTCPSGKLQAINSFGNASRAVFSSRSGRV